jgi:hypothetical protein
MKAFVESTGGARPGQVSSDPVWIRRLDLRGRRARGR